MQAYIPMQMCHFLTPIAKLQLAQSVYQRRFDWLLVNTLDGVE